MVSLISYLRYFLDYGFGSGLFFFPGRWGLLFGIIAHSVAVIMALVKLVAWVTSHVSTSEQKIKALEYQVNNDVTGRRVVGEMRGDIATIKAQLGDLRQDMQHLRKRIDS